MQNITTLGKAAALLLAVACITAGCAGSGTVTGPLAATRPLPAAAGPPDLGIARLADASDRMAAQQARDDALNHRRPGEQGLWRNRETGNAGTFTAVEMTDDAQGRPCRRLEHVFEVEGAIEQADAVACRQADGIWIALAQ